MRRVCGPSYELFFVLLGGQPGGPVFKVFRADWMALLKYWAKMNTCAVMLVMALSMVLLLGAVVLLDEVTVRVIRCGL